MLYINGNTDTYTNINEPVKEADINTPTPTTHTVVQFTIPTTPAPVPTTYRFEVHSNTDEVLFTKTNITYREVVALRATAHEVYGDEAQCMYDKACPECGYWTYVAGTTLICMNTPECTYHAPVRTKQHYTTAS